MRVDNTHSARKLVEVARKEFAQVLKDLGHGKNSKQENQSTRAVAEAIVYELLRSPQPEKGPGPKAHRRGA